MKTWLIGALVVAMVAAGVPTASEAKRLGAGKSQGMQRDMPSRTNPQTPPSTPATPAQQGTTAGAPAAAAAPGAAAAAGKRSWMGPIAGLAAGLGLAALFSSMGLGAGFANFIMMALLGIVAVVVVMFLVRRFSGANNANNQRTALAGAGTPGNSGTAGQVAWPAADSSGAPAQAPATAAFDMTDITDATAVKAAADAAIAPVKPALPAAFVPASFDGEGFARTAKLIFIRLQAANDTADLNDLRTFTTPELFAELRLEIQERGTSTQHTDVLKIDAEVLDVTNDAERQVVSVRFRGQVVEEKGAAPSDVNEVWHLVKPLDDSRSWAIAGIEQAR